VRAFAIALSSSQKAHSRDMLVRWPATLEHVPKKLLDFFDQDMLQLIDFERFLFDHMIPCDREAL
jgi:hypothetical protein